MPKALLLLLAALPALAQSDTAARLARAFDAIDRAAAASNPPGMVIGFTDRTHVLKISTYGYADIKTKAKVTPETLFEIGSVSKSFTAIALMQLMDEGKFDPKAPIAKYLPWFEMKSRYRAITGHDLLTHTAGLQNYRADLASMPFAAWSLREYEPSYAPGEHYWYSNLGFQVLGYALERIDGADYDTIIRRRVLDRVGMRSSYGAIDDALRAKLAVSYQHWAYTGEPVEAPWTEYLAADGSISSTAADMLAYARMFLNRGTGVLSERAFTALTTPFLNDYAYGLNVRKGNGETVISHGGSIAGFMTWFEVHPAAGFGMIAMGNGPLDRSLVLWAGAAVAAAMRNRPLPDAPKQNPEQVSNAAEYAGEYRGGARTLEIAAHGSRLELRAGGAAIPLKHAGGDTFRVTGELATYPLVFARQKGKVVAILHGPDWYANTSYVGPKQFPSPAEYAAYVGHYVNHNPEGGDLRIFVQKGVLMMSPGGAGSPLVSVGPATFRPAEPDFNPERIRFDVAVDGHVLRLWNSGMPMYRVESR